MNSALKKVLILGSGPCGLGAAWRLQELGFNDFLIVDGADGPGGLASSFVDDAGFTWDIGGHVQFSHYEDFDRVMDEVLPNQWLYHQRESWVWIYDRFVPYPFQNNLWRLPHGIRDRCVRQLESLQQFSGTVKRPENFREWITASFGDEISNIFMLPYNFKVWAHPLELLSYQWIGERVATVDLERVKQNIASSTDDISWGPNSKFRFPQIGGTGAIWKAVASKISPERIKYNAQVISLDANQKQVILSTGEKISYDVLLSTIPLTELSRLLSLKLSNPLLSSNSHICGIGLEGKIPDFLKTKCWMYFPESNVPFYRVTVFSNYSPNHVPDPQKHWSLMAETSSSSFKPEDASKILAATIKGLRDIGFISESQKIVSEWTHVASPGYPTPTLGRDDAVNNIFSQLKSRNIYSRGRFGAWKYEVSNQDHTFMQGFEWVDWYLNGVDEMTVFDPSSANASGKRPLRS